MLTLCHSAMGRPAVAQQLHGLGIVDFLVEVLNKSGPLQWMSCTAYLQPGSTASAMYCMKEMIEGLLASGTDITPVLVSTGYADMLVSALKAVEQVGVEEVCNLVAICACDNRQPAPSLCSCSDCHSLIIADRWRAAANRSDQRWQVPRSDRRQAPHGYICFAFLH